MLQALEQYPDFTPTLASPTLANVVQPDSGAPSTLPATSGVCGAANADLEQFLTGTLAADDTFLSGLGTMPFVGNMFQTVRALGAAGVEMGVAALELCWGKSSVERYDAAWSQESRGQHAYAGRWWCGNAQWRTWTRVWADPPATLASSRPRA